MTTNKLEYMKEYRAVNREKILKKRKEHYHKNRLKILEQKKAQYNPSKAKNRRLLKEYGISLEEYNSRAEKQDDRCACCGNHANLVVDHCHTTSNVRDLLCNRCNTVVGMVEEDLLIVDNIKDYIIKWTNRNLKNVQKV